LRPIWSASGCRRTTISERLGEAPAFGERCSGFGLAAIGKDADAGGEDADRIAQTVERKDAPADGIGADVEGE